MKITLGEALHIINCGGCFEDDNKDYPRNTKENLYYIANDETNSEKYNGGDRYYVKIVFQKHNELYAFDAIAPYYGKGTVDAKLDKDPVDVKLDEDESKYPYGNGFSEDIQDKLVLCTPFSKKTRMIEQVYYGDNKTVVKWVKES